MHILHQHNALVFDRRDMPQPKDMSDSADVSQAWAPLLIYEKGQDVDAAVEYSRKHYLAPLVSKLVKEIVKQREENKELGAQLLTPEKTILKLELGNNDKVRALSAECKTLPDDQLAAAITRHLDDELRIAADYARGWNPPPHTPAPDALTPDDIRAAYQTLPEWMRVICDHAGITVMLVDNATINKLGMSVSKKDGVVILINERGKKHDLASTMFEEIFHHFDHDPAVGHHDKRYSAFHEEAEAMVADMHKRLKDPVLPILVDPRCEPALQFLGYGARFYPKSTLMNKDAGNLAAEVLVDMAHSEVAARMSASADAARAQAKKAVPKAVFDAYDDVVQGAIRYAARIVEEKEGKPAADAKRDAWKADPFGEYAAAEKRTFSAITSFETLSDTTKATPITNDIIVTGDPEHMDNIMLARTHITPVIRDRIMAWVDEAEAGEALAMATNALYGPVENRVLAIRAVQTHGKLFDPFESGTLLVNAAQEGAREVVQAILADCPQVHFKQAFTQALTHQRIGHGMGRMSLEQALFIEDDLREGLGKLKRPAFMDTLLDKPPSPPPGEGGDDHSQRFRRGGGWKPGGPG